MARVTATSITDGARLLARHGGVVEVRMLQTAKGTVSGYFDNVGALVRAVTPWEGRASIYITANPVHPDLLARTANRLQEFAKVTTADRDIERRTWFLLDFDPVRPTGLSSTIAEVMAALTRRNEAVAFLREMDFPEPVEAMSGNGAHALYAVDLPNDEATRRLVERALKALADRFSDQMVTVDETVFNAARIWKLYGSTACKGDATAERPHRQAELESVPDHLHCVEPDCLTMLARMAPEPTRTVFAPSRNGARDLPPLDLLGAFQGRGLYKCRLPGGKHAVVCPWVAEHSMDSGLTEACLFDPPGPGEPWGFKCMHAHCTDRTIRDVLRFFALSPHGQPSGSDSDAEPTLAIMSATMAEILAADPVALQTTYVVTPWIPRAGVCTLSAKAGVGKGKLAQDLCVARAGAGTWLGLAVEPGPALFWSGEQGRREDFRVTQALCRGRGLTDPAQFPHFFEVIYDPPLRFGHPTMAARVMARLKEYPGLFIVIDSQRRAFEGDESDSAAADAFYRTVLMPLRAAGATTLTLAHPPKTTGQQKVITDENMIRGSGDWLAQLDSFMVLRPVERHRLTPQAETVTLRLIHVKPRSGPQADPLLVTFTITKDLTPEVTFTLAASTAPLEAESADTAGAIKAAAALFEEKKRLSRAGVLKHLHQAHEYGRPAGEAALTRLVALGVICPLAKEDKRKGERGHWFRFLQPLPPSEMPPDWGTEPQEEPDGR